MTSTADATATEAAPRGGGAGAPEHHAAAFQQYANDTTYSPLLFHGDALAVLQAFPTQSVDCVMTSPPYPVDLCRIPILATCPENGIVLDPFCGTGTTLLAARNMGRRSVGIDISPEYIDIARERCTGLRNPIRAEDP